MLCGRDPIDKVKVIGGSYKIALSIHIDYVVIKKGGKELVNIIYSIKRYLNSRVLQSQLVILLSLRVIEISFSR